MSIVSALFGGLANSNPANPADGSTPQEMAHLNKNSISCQENCHKEYIHSVSADLIVVRSAINAVHNCAYSVDLPKGFPQVNLQSMPKLQEANANLQNRLPQLKHLASQATEKGALSEVTAIYESIRVGEVTEQKVQYSQLAIKDEKNLKLVRQT